MTKIPPFWCGVLLVLDMELLVWLFYQLPNPAEDAPHGIAYATAVLGLIVAGIFLIVVAVKESDRLTSA